MFDLYEIFEYLLEKSFERKRVSYRELFKKFNVNYNNKLDVSNFFNHLEKAEERIINDVIGNDLLPIYSVIFHKKDEEYPGSGFYDVFMNRNRKEYSSIAGDKLSIQAYNDVIIRKVIYDKAMEILEKDLLKRFPTKNDIDEFIAEVKINRDIQIPNVLL